MRGGPNFLTRARRNRASQSDRWGGGDLEIDMLRPKRYASERSTIIDMVGKRKTIRLTRGESQTGHVFSSEQRKSGGEEIVKGKRLLGIKKTLTKRGRKGVERRKKEWGGGDGTVIKKQKMNGLGEKVRALEAFRGSGA